MSDESAEDVSFVKREDGLRLAYRLRAGAGPGVMWLGGFRSDMGGTKAEAIDGWAARTGRSYLRFDYSGHGESDGAFEDGTIGRWLADAEAILKEVGDGEQILVGSSMGGWIALLLALRAPERVAGLLLIAPAPDFTEDLMWAQFPQAIRDEIMSKGAHLAPSEYEQPTPITRALIEDGRNHLLLDKPIELAVPVRILLGGRDADVPWRHAFRLVDGLAGDDVVFTLVKDGDHRLSRPEDLDRLTRALDDLVAAVSR